MFKIESKGPKCILSLFHTGKGKKNKKQKNEVVLLAQQLTPES